MEDLDGSLWSDKCNHRTTDECDNLNPLNYNFIVMQLNIRSLLSNIGELKLLLTKLEQRNLTVDVILPCDTFLSKNTEKLVKIPHYHLYANYRSKHKGGGMAILVRDGILHKRRKDIEIMKEKEAESMYVEMTAKGGKHILGSVYKSPNTCENTLKNHLTELLNKIKFEKGNKELVIGMDHNMNLLKKSRTLQNSTILRFNVGT